MTTYYVSPDGNDGNNGLGPDASHASNKPFLTIHQILAHSLGDGDTAYIAPGVYREVVTVATTSPTTETKILGDPRNAQGFKTAAGVLLPPGEVQWTAYTTNDTTAPSANSVVELAGRDYLTFKYLTMVGGNDSAGSVIDASTATSTNITLTSCLLYGYSQGGSSRSTILTVPAANVAEHWVFDSCIFLGALSNYSIKIAGAAPSAADLDTDFQIRNCLFLGSGGNPAVYFGPTAGTYKRGGVDICNSTFLGSNMGAYGEVVTASGASTTIPCTVTNSLFMSLGGLNAAAEGQITEDYNLLACAAPRTNVSGANAGAHSVLVNAPLIHVGQELLWGANLRPFGMPTAGSPLLGFGTTPATNFDLLGNPRPGGGASALVSIGAYERSNTFAREVTTVKTGTNAISALGPAIQDFQLPVDATSTTVTVYGRYDATYTGTLPQMLVYMGGECGVADASDTMVEAADTWEQLSLNFTPTAAGVVTIRLQSNDTHGDAAVFFDDFAVA